ncbi:haloacid dehalogenase [Neofusicoccum parvum]|uniref:Haloacid dehalogenase n=1 Tax=Neofusicoccum parvum TaxID=310453 RepID=A0ACB5SP68_9PEZI|nr:haloacid dehalogenase [Neofusicoccum parvum]GME55160.1 haloacid dehalogenase [Neofusicoccum parvum]
MSATSDAIGPSKLTSISTSIVATPPSHNNGEHDVQIYETDNESINSEDDYYYETDDNVEDDFKTNTRPASKVTNNALKPTTGLTTYNRATTTTIGLLTPTRLTVQVPLLTLLTSPAHPLRTALLAAHLRHNPILLLPSRTGLHLAINYHTAGTPAAALAIHGPAAPFAAAPLPRALLPSLRAFTLLVPTHAGWLSDAALATRQMARFLLAGHGRDDTGSPDAAEQAWFAAQVGAQRGAREHWDRVVAECVMALGSGVVGALRADGADGAEARARVRGRVVFQEWCDGWGEGCGADAGLVRRVREKVRMLERCYGRVMRGRVVLEVGEEEVGVWGMERDEV